MLQEQFPDLSALYGQGALSGYLGGQQIDAARKSQKINQDFALQDMFQKQQSFPVELGYKQALTDQSLSSARHMDAQTKGLGLKNKMDEDTYQERYKAEIEKLARQMSDDELAKTENSIWQLTMDPSTRAVGEHLAQGMRDIYKERAKQKERFDAQLELQRQRGEDQLNLQKAKSEQAARIAKIKSETLGKMSLEQAIVHARTMKSQATPGTPEYDMAEALEGSFLRDWYAGQQLKGVAPGQIDPSKVTNLPSAQPMPAPGPAQLPGALVKPGVDLGAPSMQQVDPQVITKAFGKYEPEKYVYRIGPNGVPQRKPKGK